MKRFLAIASEKSPRLLQKISSLSVATETKEENAWKSSPLVGAYCQ